MIPVCPDFYGTLDGLQGSRLKDFEQAWEAHPAGTPPPRWQDFLPRADTPCPPNFLFALLRTDVERRIAAGLPALLVEPYFDKPLLDGAEADRDLLLELVRREYHLRRRQGNPVQRQQYVNRFPQLENSVAALLPTVACPSCARETPRDDEDTTASLCFACGAPVPAPQGPSAAVPPTRFSRVDEVHSAPAIPPTALPSGTGTQEVPLVTQSGPAPRRLGRYELGAKIAHGGMGAVYHAHDPELRRDLAVKVLKPDLQWHPELVKRFLVEARITGQLQHPGVVAVHDIGRDEHGLPFLVMKLVRGQTLEELLQQRSCVAEDLSRWLGAFEQVCQTVAFAHSRRVIHRDLKPANVMVGRFQEVQVMDWGLAKVLGDPEERTADAEAHADVRMIDTREDDVHTRGTLGTPTFMPPEQALGEWELVDERADVFALGGILCQVLTGEPAYAGKALQEVLSKARRGAVKEALQRLTACGAEAELVRLAEECLSPEISERPRDAAEVARRVGEYRISVEQRLRAAEQEQAAAAARGEERLRAAEELRREAEARLRAEEASRAEAHARAEQAQAAVRAERKARGRLLALAAVVVAAVSLGGSGWSWYAHDQTLRRARAETDAKTALNEAQRVLDEERELEHRDPERWAAKVDLADSAVTRAEAEVASVAVRADLVERVRALRQKVGPMVRDCRLHVELDRIRLEKAVVREGRYDFAAAVSHYRGALTDYGIDLTNPERAARLVRSSRLRSELLGAMEDWARATKDPEERKQLCRVLEVAEPEEEDFRARWRAAVRKGDGLALASLARGGRNLAAADQVNLAGDLVRLKEGKAAEELLREARMQSPDDFWVNHDLGQLLENQAPPQLEDAVRYLTAAAALRSKAPGVMIHLGNALHDKRQVGEAIRCYRKAIELDPKCALAYTNLGRALVDNWELDEAILAHKKAIELAPKLALAHSNLGGALRNKGQVEEAFAHNKKALEIDPMLAAAHNSMGGSLQEKGQLEDAIRCYQKALELRPDYADAHNGMALALREKGQLEESIRWFRQAIQLVPNFAHAHNNLGNALREKGELDAAIHCLQRAIQLDPKNALAYTNMGVALQGKGQSEDAIGYYQKAIAVNPKHALAHYNLANALRAKGQLEESIRCFRNAIELSPKNAIALCNLGDALADKGELDEAIRCYQTAIGLAPGYAGAHNSLGLTLKVNGQLDEAIRCFRKTIEVDPKLALAHNNLGFALQAKGKLNEAIQCYQKAIKLQPGLAMAHNNLGSALHHDGDLEEAVRSYQKAIELDPKFALAYTNLGLALKTKEQLDDAVRCFQKVIELDPKDARGHGNLAQALLVRGDLDEARKVTRRCLDSLPAQHPMRDFLSRQLRQCETACTLNEKLPGILRGDARAATAAESLALAEVCQQYKQMNAAAARLYADAFAAEPKLAADMQAQHRYNAACSAALAAAGQGKGAGKLAANERQRLRQQALAWLRADLDAWGNGLAAAKSQDRDAIRKVLEHWHKDADLAAVRDDKPLATLPAEERDACKKLWTDAAALLGKAKTRP